MNIRSATLTDATGLAILHKRCLRSGILSKLPVQFLASFYKNAIINNSFCVVVLELNDNVHGGVMVSFGGAFKSKYLLPYIHSINVLVKGCLKKFPKHNKIHTHSSKKDSIPNIEFLFVDEVYRSLNYGAHLLSFCKSYTNVMTVCTLNAKENKAISFYRKNEFHDEKKFTSYQKPFLMLKWVG